MAVKKGLGKGLGALITTAEVDEHEAGTNVIEVDINSVEPNKEQPRRSFDQEALEELAESIKANGVIQPIIVTKEKDGYTIIAGERRWRASRLAKLKTVPVIVREYTPQQTLEIALIENIQREDLNPLEEAQCYKRLVDEFSFTHEQVACKIGKNRSYVTNAMRLLGLDSRVANFVSEGRLSSGAGRALLGVCDMDQQFKLAETAIEEGWNVRSIEQAVKETNEKSNEDVKKMIERPKRVKEYKTLEEDLKNALQAPVQIKEGKNHRGRIEISYYSQDELDRLLLLIRNAQ